MKALHIGWHLPDAATGRSQKMKSQLKKLDVLVRNEGTVFVFCPLTPAAKQWIDENVESDSWQWFGNTLVVGHRYAWGLCQGMRDAGLVLA